MTKPQYIIVERFVDDDMTIESPLRWSGGAAGHLLRFNPSGAVSVFPSRIVAQAAIVAHSARSDGSDRWHANGQDCAPVRLEAVDPALVVASLPAGDPA